MGIIGDGRVGREAGALFRGDLQFEDLAAILRQRGQSTGQKKRTGEYAGAFMSIPYPSYSSSSRPVRIRFIVFPVHAA